MYLPTVYGITHDADTGEIMARVPRSTKVNIGLPKDSGLHVIVAAWTDPKSKDKRDRFALQIGRATQPEVRWYDFDKIDLLQRDYNALMKDPSVVKRRAPQKLNYFTFLKAGPDGVHIHDLECILRHGPNPRSINIVITDDRPFVAGYQKWLKRGLQCSGDGRDAKRSIHFTPTEADKEAAEQARSMGRIWFPIIDGCASRGCEYALPLIKTRDGKTTETRQCGPTASLGFQLVNDIRLGAKAEVVTTGIRSTNQLLASLIELATFTGRGEPLRGSVRGIPLVLSVREFQTNHNNVPGKAYSLALEFRGESIKAVQRQVMEAAETFGSLMGQLPEAEPVAQPETVERLQLEAASLPETASPEETPADVLAEDEVEGEFRSAQFNLDDEAGEEVEETPAETFDDAKAELMMDAESDAAEPAEQTLFQPEGKKENNGPYVDPGEQGEPKQRRGVKFGGKK